MNRLKIIPALFALLFCLSQTPSAPACPSCQASLEDIDKSAANSIELEKQTNLANAFNQSIYLFVSVPYLLLGFFGVLIYRGMKKNESFRKNQVPPETEKPGDEKTS